MRVLAAVLLSALAVACSDSGSDPSPADDAPTARAPDAGGGSDDDAPGAPVDGASGGGTNGDPVPPPPAGRPLAEPAGYYEADGYGTLDVIRIDVRTVTTPGTCTVEDQSGCTLADVIADVDAADELKVDIPVHFRATDFPDDGRETNAELRQRGASVRQETRKSFRVELRGDGVRWRGEDRLQLNKHPFDNSKIRNKLAFDLMARIPDFASSRTQFANLWIDDGAGPIDYGVFTHVEASGDEYLENRGWDKAGNFYKAEKFLFSNEDLRFMEIDAEGAPVDEDAFETRVEIRHGEDHRALVNMVRAVADRSVPFEETLARHFDEDNVLTWVAVNFLLQQLDAVTHNYYLYNPAGTERFYFLPWDYDYAFGVEEPPADGFDTAALERRLAYGYGKGRASEFLSAFYSRPGVHAKVLAKAAELRAGPLSDATVAELASRYTAVVTPIALAGTDARRYKPEESAAFAGFVSRSHDALRTTYAIPLPPNLEPPRVEDGRVRFAWSDAHAVAGGTVTYDLEVASSPAFGPGERVFLESGIADAGERIELDVPVAAIGSGRRFVRLVARVDTDPARFWQIASDRETIDGVPRIGTLEFAVP